MEKVAQLMGLLAVEEEERIRLAEEGDSRADQVDHLARKTGYLQERLHLEEEAKRRTLLRYIHSVKAQATAQIEAARLTSDFNEDIADTLASNGGVIQLAESGIGDEEVHALAALLRGNQNITELNLRANVVTDEGARALGAVLAGTSALRTIDLRENSVGKAGVRGVAESLERAGRVRHVYVHAGGKIEALGTGAWAAPRAGADGAGAGAAPQVTVETVCVVDVRENNPAPKDAAGLPLDDTMGGASQRNPALQQNASMSMGGGQGGGGGGRQSQRRSPRSDGDRRWAEKTGDGAGNGRRKIRKGGKPRVRKGGPGGKKKESAAERKRRERQQAKEAKELHRSQRTEAGWQGRAGGMEQKGITGKKKRRGGGTSSGMSESLPPLHGSQSQQSLPDASSTMPADVSGHIQRANAAAEAILAPAGGSGKSTGGQKKKPTGAFSAQLQNSPLMQPAGFGRAGKQQHTK